jgi:hypothetical protein
VLDALSGRLGTVSALSAPPSPAHGRSSPGDREELAHWRLRAATAEQRAADLTMECEVGCCGRVSARPRG